MQSFHCFLKLILKYVAVGDECCQCSSSKRKCCRCAASIHSMVCQMHAKVKLKKVPKYQFLLSLSFWFEEGRGKNVVERNFRLGIQSSETLYSHLKGLLNESGDWDVTAYTGIKVCL